jgi:hypothetical protein
VCVALSALLSGCGSGGGDIDNTAIPSVPRRFGSLEFTATATHSRYVPGTQVPLTLTVRNVGTQTAKIGVTGCQVAFDVMQRGQRIGPPPPDCPPSSVVASIAPGATQNFDTVWDQTDSQGRRVSVGSYAIDLWLTATSIDGVPVGPDAKTNLSAEPILVLVQYL